MKTLIVAFALVSGMTYAKEMYKSNLGEVSVDSCDCKTCLIENGICLRTKTNEDRTITDKARPSAPKKGKQGAAGATKS